MYKDIVASQSGDTVAKEKIVSQNMGLVRSAALRFKNRQHEFEDLCQIGSIGLIKAIDRFDVTSGNCFSTYAFPLIIGEIKRFLRDDGAVKISRGLKELSLKIYKLRQKKEFADATVGKIAKELGATEEDVAYALQSTASVSSLDEICENGIAIGDKNDCFVNADNRIMIWDMLSKLSHDDRKLVILRYFNQKTQSETAKIIGESQVWVSRREKKILKLMRESAG